jgi:hypothetical protein
MSHTALAVVRDGAPHEAPAGTRHETRESAHRIGRPNGNRVRDEIGATTAEYATVTGCGVGFAAVLFKFLTSSAGQDLLKLIFNAIKALLPF